MSDHKVESISIVVPFYNEEENAEDVYLAIKKEVELLNLEYEILFIDDGSRDKTYQIISSLADSDPKLKVIKFQFNCGQTAAMQAGFDHAINEVIIPMDGDMQNDPSDIKLLIEKIEEGYDVVSGWRKNRQDKTITRKIPSMIANKIISIIGGVSLNDYGCSLKAYRKTILDNVNLYGEMHRFIPIYASWYGAKVTEVPVKHHPRTKGQSKYGLSRTIKVLLDLVTIIFLGNFSTKPIYFFGTLGFVSYFLAFISILYVIWRQIVSGEFINSPAFLIAVMSILLGSQFIMMGLLAEIQIRTYHESQSKKPYVVEKSHNLT